ncbi:MAG: FAD-binding oxidoreductase [Peptococcaceae bacterium]
MLDKKIIRDLKKIVGGEEYLVCTKIPLTTFSYDASQFFGMPDAVVFPTEPEMVSEIFKYTKKSGIKIVPRGAGTCLSGGAVACEGGILISMNKMNKILAVNPTNRTVLAEAGVTNKQIQIIAEPYGLMYPPDPASMNVSTIGGNIAENAGGMRGVKYGCTKDHVLGLEVVLPSGDIIRTGQLMGHNDQIDLTYLLCGSEGTLGIVTKALLSLTPLNPSVVTMTATFRDLGDAGQCVADIFARGIVPTTMEIMDNTLIRAVEDYAKLGLPKEAASLLLLEIDGHSSEVQAQIPTITDIFKKNNAVNSAIAKDENERQALWKARRSANGALGKLKPSMVVQDVVVPVDRLAVMLKNVSQIAAKYGITIAQLAHAGDGNLHPHLLYDYRIPEDVEKVEHACDEIFREALAQGGTLSGEHGIGLEKIKFMPVAFDEVSIKFMKSIKETFDPDALLNAGKVLP